MGVISGKTCLFFLDSLRQRKSVYGSKMRLSIKTNAGLPGKDRNSNGSFLALCRFGQMPSAGYYDFIGPVRGSPKSTNWFNWPSGFGVENV